MAKIKLADFVQCTDISEFDGVLKHRETYYVDWISKDGSSVHL